MTLTAPNELVRARTASAKRGLVEMLQGEVTQAQIQASPRNGICRALNPVYFTYSTTTRNSFSHRV